MKHRKLQPTDPKALDVGTRAPHDPPPDPALFVGNAAQEAVRDAPVVDVAGLRANTARLPATTRIATERDLASAESVGRTKDDIDALDARETGLRAGIGPDALALGGGEVSVGTRARHCAAEAAAADERVVEHARRLAAQHASPPALGRFAFATVWCRAWGLTVLVPVVEIPLVASALSVATRTENPWEAWALAMVCVFGLLALPHQVGAQLHERRVSVDGRGGSMVAVAVASGLWLAMVLTLAAARTVAAHHDAGSAGTTSGFVTVNGAATITHQPTMPTPALYILFLVMVAMVSVAAFIVAWRSSAEDQLNWLRAHRARNEARAVSIVAAQQKDTLGLLREHIGRERVAVAESGALYVTEVLPQLAMRAVGEYHAQLAREMNEPAAFDAIRLLDTTIAEPVEFTDPRGFVPPPVAAAEVAITTNPDHEVGPSSRSLGLSEVA